MWDFLKTYLSFFKRQVLKVHLVLMHLEEDDRVLGSWGRGREVLYVVWSRLETVKPIGGYWLEVPNLQ